MTVCPGMLRRALQPPPQAPYEHMSKQRNLASCKRSTRAPGTSWSSEPAHKHIEVPTTQAASWVTCAMLVLSLTRGSFCTAFLPCCHHSKREVLETASYTTTSACFPLPRSKYHGAAAVCLAS
eukprot:5959388-Amphidinium_carterae.1